MNLRFLVVEDEKLWQIQFTALFDYAGAQAEVAGNWTEALQKLAVEEYDGALIDICLDRATYTPDCQLFIAQLHASHPELPVIAVTSKPLTASEGYSLNEQGVIKFLQKQNLRPSDFQDAITKAANKRAAKVRKSRHDFFLSYRRLDSAGYAVYLYEHLSKEFGDVRVFMDVHSIHAGQLFPAKIDDALQSCCAMLLMIGPMWTKITDAHGNARLFSNGDYVHLEVSTAIRRNVKIIPVLVNGAHMPRRTELPSDLGKLAEFESVALTSGWNASHVLEYIDSVLRKALRRAESK